MIRTLEQRVRYDDSQCLRRLEFDGEIIPRGLVRSEQARTISTDSTMNSMSGSTPLNVPFAITPTAGVGRSRPFRWVEQSRKLREANELLAEVLAFEEGNQSARRVLEAVDHGLAILELSVEDKTR